MTYFVINYLDSGWLDLVVISRSFTQITLLDVEGWTQPRHHKRFFSGVSTIIINSFGHNGAYKRQWILSAMVQIMPRRGEIHYINQCWLIDNSYQMNIFQGNVIQVVNIFIQNNAL